MFDRIGGGAERVHVLYDDGSNGFEGSSLREIKISTEAETHPLALSIKSTHKMVRPESDGVEISQVLKKKTPWTHLVVLRRRQDMARDCRWLPAQYM